MRARTAGETARAPTASDLGAVAALDLLRHIPDISPRRIGDLRGGPETDDGLLANRFPGAEIVPIEFAGAHGDDASRSFDRRGFQLSFGGGPPPREPFDLIFANGALDMLPCLGRLAPELLRLTKPGGLLAFQLPDNLHEPNRQLLRMVAVDGPWAKALISVAKSRPFNASIEELDLSLRPLCRSIEFWRTTYMHRPDNAAEIIAEMRKTSLAPFLQRLDSDMRVQFLQRYAAELTQAYPPRSNGKVLWKFPRIFFLARR